MTANTIINIPVPPNAAARAQAATDATPPPVGVINSAQGAAAFTGASATATLAWKLLKTIFGSNARPEDFINLPQCGALIALVIGFCFAYASAAPPPADDTTRAKVGRWLATFASILTIIAATLGINNPAPSGSGKDDSNKPNATATSTVKPGTAK